MSTMVDEVLLWNVHLRAGDSTPPRIHRLRIDGKSGCGMVDGKGQPYRGAGTGGVTTLAAAERVPGSVRCQAVGCYGG